MKRYRQLLVCLAVVALVVAWGGSSQRPTGEAELSLKVTSSGTPEESVFEVTLIPGTAIGPVSLNRFRIDETITIPGSPLRCQFPEERRGRCLSTTRPGWES